MTQAPGLTLGDDGDVCVLAELLVTCSEQLANPALKAVTANGIANFSTHRYAKTRSLPCRDHQHYEVGGVIVARGAPEVLIL